MTLAYFLLNNNRTWLGCDNGRTWCAKSAARPHLAERVWRLQTISAEKKTEYYERINTMESVQRNERVAEALGFSL